MPSPQCIVAATLDRSRESLKTSRLSLFRRFLTEVRLANPRNVREFTKNLRRESVTGITTKVSYPIPSGEPETNLDQRHSLIMNLVAAVNRELDLSAVLESLVDGLRPLVPVDAVSVTIVHGDRYRFKGLHVDGLPRISGEEFVETAARALRTSAQELRSLLPGELPVKGSGVEYVARTRQAWVCNHLAAQSRFPEDRIFTRLGIQAYVRQPLYVQDRLIGAMKFFRRRAVSFDPGELAVLDEVTGVVASAVANTLAYEEITRLTANLNAENLVLRQEAAVAAGFPGLVGRSPALQTMLQSVGRVAATTSTVLITGETGTGKELVARAIHESSPRAAKPIVKVNCAALPEALVASELFGHERGAFTGALQRKLGRFEIAHGGTLFLDEVGELSLEAQALLLRVIQEREFERLGGSSTIQVDVRLIAATNRDLAGEVRAGRFREDLFYRLNVFPIHSPPLRDRVGDIPLLAEHIAARSASRMGKRITSIDRSSIAALCAYPWPGNVRELQNVIERAIILSDAPVLRLSPHALPWHGEAPGPPVAGAAADLFEEIENALRKAKGRISGPRGAAQILQVPASTLESRIRALGIDKFRFRGGSGS